MGFRYSAFLENEIDTDSARIFSCKDCRTHLSSTSLLISESYTGKTGDAYLMCNVINVMEGLIEKRKMTTGYYTVADILCHQCKKCVGWRYLRSDSYNQKYKEGKYILEVSCIRAVKN